MIALSHVTLSYGARPAVEDVSFAIKPGENLCMVGPNGSGKSTLIKGMLGLMKPEGGEIRRDPGLKVAYLAQAHTFERDFPATVWEIVLSGTLGRSLNPLYTRAQKARAKEALARVPCRILPQAHRRAFRRAAAARAVGARHRARAGIDRDGRAVLRARPGDHAGIVRAVR